MLSLIVATRLKPSLSHSVVMPTNSLSLPEPFSNPDCDKTAEGKSGEYSPPNRLAAWWFVVYLLSILQTPMRKTNLFGGVYLSEMS